MHWPACYFFGCFFAFLSAPKNRAYDRRFRANRQVGTIRAIHAEYDLELPLSPRGAGAARADSSIGMLQNHSQIRLLIAALATLTTGVRGAHKIGGGDSFDFNRRMI